MITWSHTQRNICLTLVFLVLAFGETSAQKKRYLPASPTDSEREFFEVGVTSQLLRLKDDYFDTGKFATVIASGVAFHLHLNDKLVLNASATVANEVDVTEMYRSDNSDDLFTSVFITPEPGNGPQVLLGENRATADFQVLSLALSPYLVGAKRSRFAWAPAAPFVSVMNMLYLVEYNAAIASGTRTMVQLGMGSYMQYRLSRVNISFRAYFFSVLEGGENNPISFVDNTNYKPYVGGYSLQLGLLYRI